MRRHSAPLDAALLIILLIILLSIIIIIIIIIVVVIIMITAVTMTMMVGSALYPSGDAAMLALVRCIPWQVLINCVYLSV